MWPDWAIYWTLGKFLMPLAPINLPKSSIFFGNFCKGVKIYHFSSEIIFGHLLKTFGDFYWSHCNQHNLSFLAHITSAVHCQYTFSCLSALFPFTLSLSLSLSLSLPSLILRLWGKGFTIRKSLKILETSWGERERRFKRWRHERAFKANLERTKFSSNDT